MEPFQKRTTMEQILTDETQWRPFVEKLIQCTKGGTIIWKTGLAATRYEATLSYADISITKLADRNGLAIYKSNEGNVREIPADAEILARLLLSITQAHKRSLEDAVKHFMEPDDFPQPNTQSNDELF